MLKGLIILLFTFTCTVSKDITRYDKNTCYDKTAGDYCCCSDYEEINGECIKCSLGFISRKGNPCEPCGLNVFGKGCLQTCICHELQRCDNVKGCVEIETTSTLTIESNTAATSSLEESVTKVHKEEQNDGISKIDLLMLYAGASSGIIVLLGIIGITKCLKKRILMSESRREKPTEEELHVSEEPEMQQAFAFNESFNETIDDSHLDSISVPQYCNPNPGHDDESQGSVVSTNYINDRSSYLDPVSSPITMKSSWLDEEQSQETFSSTRISTFIQNQTSCSPCLEKDSESSISEISTNCNDDQSNYQQPFCSLISNDSSFHTAEHSHKVFPSANNSTCIADQTTCDPFLAIEGDDLDDSSTEFSEDATHDRSSYLHPYNILINKTSSCHIYKICQNEPFSG